jgi:hypothetical protein
VVGAEHVITFKRFMCKACKQYLPSEEEVATHLKTFTHWQKCVEAAESSPTEKTVKKLVRPVAVVESTTMDDDDDDDDDDVAMEEEESASGKAE